MKLLRCRSEGENASLIPLAEHVHDLVFIQRGVAFYRAEKREICPDGFWLRRIGKSLHHFAGRIDIGANDSRDTLALQTKNGNNAVLSRIFAIPVAAASGLQHGVQSCLLAPDRGEIYIHAGFDQ